MERIFGGFHEDWATERNEYSRDSIMRELLHWIGKRSEASFFLYLALTIPHAKNERSRGNGDCAEVPDHGIY